jgi:hypothetical protein
MLCLYKIGSSSSFSKKINSYTQCVSRVNIGLKRDKEVRIADCSSLIRLNKM